MPQILHVFKTGYPKSFGGVEQVIYQLALSTCQQGFGHEVLILHDGPEYELHQRPEARVHCVPASLDLLSTPMSWAYLRHYRQLARRADLIHYHFPYPFADLAHCLFNSGKPSLVTYHSDVVKQKIAKRLYAPLMHRFLGSVERIVATSDNYVASSEVLQRYRDKTHVVPLGIDEASYPRPDESRGEQWRKRVGQGFFFFIGALRYYKGLHVLIEAARQTGLPVVIGGAGGIESDLRQQAAGLDNIHWTGFLSEEDKAALFRLSGAFVFPSHLRSEAFGVGLLEAAMHGKPMISTDIGTGTNFVNQHDETGLVVAPDDPAALAQAMRQLAGEPVQAERFALSARKRYEALFTAQRMGDAYREHYLQLIGRSADE
ncbi:glycosyltransferase [Marinobacterium arenosum]|uniref:glycosyltransferase n=1 Tax=Marinobacterium arenosum TaxID=2862496 RepID=UPI001C93D562|nr:glycosyltransferase [Marinobacterium arenosum]MBY4676795.1 glycosyltransferase [Marinobacterium arenosum]